MFLLTESINHTEYGLEILIKLILGALILRGSDMVITDVSKVIFLICFMIRLTIFQ